MYALEGRGRVTSKVYPTDFETEWGMALFASPPGATAAADVWAMTSIWVDDVGTRPDSAWR